MKDGHKFINVWIFKWFSASLIIKNLIEIYFIPIISCNFSIIEILLNAFSSIIPILLKDKND